MGLVTHRETWGREPTRNILKGGYTPIALDAIPVPPPRRARLAVRLTLLFVAAGLGPVAAALVLAALRGGAEALAATALVSALALGASVAAARFMARSVTGPMAELVRATERLGAGDFGGRVDEAGPAELIELGRSWNAASRRLAVAREENRALLASLERGYVETLRALVNAIDAKDPYTRGHSQRTAEVAVAIAERLGLEAHEVREVEFGGLLHDIGKIGIAEQILRKPARLDEDETRVMRGHPRIGDGIVSTIDFLAPMRAMVRNHHERWDGHGYPDGLHGEEIPLGARIISAADAFDAITSDRCYQPGRPIGEAVAILRNLSGGQLDPQVVEALLAVLGEQGLLEAAPPDDHSRPKAILPDEPRPKRVTLDFAVRKDQN